MLSCKVSIHVRNSHYNIFRHRSSNKYFSLCLSSILYCILHIMFHFYSNQQHMLNRRFCHWQQSNYHNFHGKEHSWMILPLKHYQKDIIISINFLYYNLDLMEHLIKNSDNLNSKYYQSNIRNSFLDILNR